MSFLLIVTIVMMWVYDVLVRITKDLSLKLGWIVMLNHFH